MSALISAFVALVLTAALAFGSDNGNTQAKEIIEANAEESTKADVHLEDNPGLKVATDSHLGVTLSGKEDSKPQPSLTPKPLVSVTPAPQKPLLEAVLTPVKAEVGTEISAEAKSDAEAEVDKTVQDNAGENKGQAVSGEVKTEVSENLTVEIPEIVSLKLGL